MEDGAGMEDDSPDIPDQIPAWLMVASRAWVELSTNIREDFTITEKAPRASTFHTSTFKTLLRHYAKVPTHGK